MASAELLFDGSSPTELDLLIASIGFQALSTGDYDEDPAKTALFLSKFVGAARPWAARYLANDPDLMGGSFIEAVQSAKLAFGYDDNQAAAIARADLSRLRQTGTLPAFFADFDDLCGRADINSDAPKMTMLLEKLKPQWRSALILHTGTPQNYLRARTYLMNIAASGMEGVDTQRIQDAKPKCSHCKKRGHTKSECRKILAVVPIKVEGGQKN